MSVEPERIRRLNAAPAADGGRYVLYWMQQSQRERFNPALEHALRLANRRREPLVVGFGVTEAYPEANERHFAFMLEGLAETAAALAGRGIKLVMRRGAPERVALDLGRDASVVVCDRGYLRHQVEWRRVVAAEAGRRVIEVEGDVVVPTALASDKAEHAARTLRPKLRGQLGRFLGGLGRTAPVRPSLRLPVHGDLDPRAPGATLAALDLDRGVGPSGRFRPGTAQASRSLATFLAHRLAGYADGRNDPSDPRTSGLAPYLHFGQISPVEVARRVRAAASPSDADKEAFLEQVIVRRELAINFVLHTPGYERYASLPAWARRTLDEHRADARPHRYGRRELEAGRTHDRYWNAAMREMTRTGYLHNHMRMYWGKKILEWSETPEGAFRTALGLNNRFLIDGRDPNSYANVAWLFGRHDRPWAERAIFGKVRYMNAAGLERKFDIDAYVEWTQTL